MDELITLIHQEDVQLDTGAMVARETPVEVWATLSSIYRQEFLDPGAGGYHAVGQLPRGTERHCAGQEVRDLSNLHCTQQ